jgi:hypothetical protein
MAKGTFYVYEHWRPDTDVCFYVGKGRGIRANNMSKRNPHHKAIQAKLACMGMTVEVRMVSFGLSEEKAFSEETKRIKFWKNMGIVLSNKCEGGGGVSGYVHTDEAKIKISINNKKLGNVPPVLFGKDNPFYGKTHSEEARKAIAEATRKRVVSEATRRKMSETRKRLGIKPPTRAKKKESV